MARVQTRPTSRYVVDVCNECPGFFQIHARTLTVRLKVQNQKSLSFRVHKVQEELRLLYAVAASTKVVGSPQESGVESAGLVQLIGWILKAYTLRCLVDDPENAILLIHFLEVHVLVVMGQVDHGIDLSHTPPHSLGLDRQMRKASRRALLSHLGISHSLIDIQLADK